MRKCKKIISLALAAFLTISNIEIQLTYAKDGQDVTTISDSNEMKSNDTTLPELDGNKMQDNNQTDDKKNAINSPEQNSKEQNSSSNSEIIDDGDSLLHSLNIKSISIDNTEVTTGKYVTIRIKTYNKKLSIDFIQILFKSEKSTERLINLSYYETGDEFYGYFYINKNIDNGIWKADSIKLWDPENNKTLISASQYNMSFLNFNVIQDTKPPTVDLDSIKVDKKDVKPGDSVKISLKASDDRSGIQSIELRYCSPTFSYYNNSKSLYVKYNSQTDFYEGSILIDDFMAEGTWTLGFIGAKDNAGNYSPDWYYKPIENANINVKNDNGDSTPPTLDINSMNVCKKRFHYAEEVRVSVKAFDDKSGIKEISVSYNNYSCNDVNRRSRSMRLRYNPDTDLYEGNFVIDKECESGLWEISVYAIDNCGNSYFYDLGDKYKSLSFILTSDEKTNNITPISNCRLIYGNAVAPNLFIDGDLYIAADAYVILYDSTVTGNIYVLGQLNCAGGVNCKGTIYTKEVSYAPRVHWKEGLTHITGKNSINSISTTSKPVIDVPIRIDNTPIIDDNKKISLKGATIDIGDMYIEDQLIDLDDTGTFDIKDLYVGDKTSITFKYLTLLGYTITKTLNLKETEEDLNSDGFTDISDLALLGNNYNKTSEDKDWNAKLDLNKDNIIDIYDICRVTSKMDK